LLVGSLKFQYLELVKLKETKSSGDKKNGTDIGRLSIAQGPDGYIYIGVEGKEFLKSPQLVC
jgi:hypothetical protein